MISSTSLSLVSVEKTGLKNLSLHPSQHDHTVQGSAYFLEISEDIAEYYGASILKDNLQKIK